MVKSILLMQEIKKSFNHFKLHTQYSICEGAIKIEDLEYFCKNNKIKSIGISDTSNLCGVLQFSETVSKSKTQPIIGSQIKFKHKDLTGLIPIIAKNDINFLFLCKKEIIFSLSRLLSTFFKLLSSNGFFLGDIFLIK